MSGVLRFCSIAAEAPFGITTRLTAYCDEVAADAFFYTSLLLYMILMLDQ